jgi:anaerobic ribonucleoside-triphosphate reductase activating protein
MLRYHSYDIVFREVPGEVTLAISLSNCPHRCPGCHSPYLQSDLGEELDEAVVGGLLDRYGQALTCVCFMGGDADPELVQQLALFVRARTGSQLKTAWYSGKAAIPDGISVKSFDYIKLGPYVEKLGGLDSPHTNQRFYKVDMQGQLTLYHYTCFAK